ncbi:B2 protein [Tanacetum coccineum]
MSNSETKRECLDRKLFGLPYNMSAFVLSVKKGMLLFLFEFENRLLFVVLRATSDGEINIQPGAYRKKFPAHVYFTTVWDCNPLAEHNFRDAIKDNYYSVKKFKFGLMRLGQSQLDHSAWKDGMYAADMSANGRGDIIRRAIILDLMRRFADVVDAKDIGLGICKRNNIELGSGQASLCTLSTIGDHASSNQMNQQAFSTRMVQSHGNPTDGVESCDEETLYDPGSRKGSANVYLHVDYVARRCYRAPKLCESFYSKELPTSRPDAVLISTWDSWDCSRTGVLRASYSYDRRGHMGERLLIFETSVVGYIAAMHLNEYFENQGTYFNALGNYQILFNPGGFKRRLYELQN